MLLPLVLSCGWATPRSEPAVGELWKESSTHLALDITPSFHVRSRFEADREQFSDEQLQALSHVKLGNGSQLCADCDSYGLAITDADGSVATYSDIDRTSIQPFLDTFDCYSTEFNPFSRSSPRAQQWSTAPVLSSLDSACWHGVNHYPCEDMHFWLSIEEPGSYLVSVDACTPDLSLELVSDEMATLVSATDTSAGCPILSHEFTESGTYGLIAHRATTGSCEAGAMYYGLKLAAAQR